MTSRLLPALCSPIKKSSRRPRAAATTAIQEGGDPFLAALAQAEERDEAVAQRSQSLRVPRALAALETVGADEKPRRKHRSGKSPMVQIVMDESVRVGPATRSATRSGVTPLLHGLGLTSARWPVARAGAAAGPSVPALADFWGPHASSIGASSSAAAAEPERPKSVSRTEKAAAKKARAKARTTEKAAAKKVAAAKKQLTKAPRHLVPYRLPHSEEVVFLSPSQLAELSGTEVKSGKQMSKMLNHILATS